MSRRLLSRLRYAIDAATASARWRGEYAIDAKFTRRRPHRHGTYIKGLYLEGAAWDVEEQCLIRQPPKILVQELPIMMIIPVELNKLKLHGTIRVPLYITQQRRNAMGVGMMMEADLDVHDSMFMLSHGFWGPPNIPVPARAGSTAEGHGHGHGRGHGHGQILLRPHFFHTLNVPLSDTPGLLQGFGSRSF